MLYKLTIFAAIALLAVFADHHGDHSASAKESLCPPPPKDEVCGGPSMRDQMMGKMKGGEHGKGEGHGDKPEMKMRRHLPEHMQRQINNGIENATEQIMNILDQLVSKMDDELECDVTTDTVVDVKNRGPQVVVQVNCDDEIKYGNFYIRFHETEVKDSPPIVPRGKPMPGGYAPMCEMKQGYHYFKAIARKENCSVDFLNCMEQVVSGGNNMYCPVVCNVSGTEVVNHTYLNFLVDGPSITLNSVTDEPENDCFKKMTIKYLDNLVFSSSENTFRFLADHCGFGDFDTISDPSGGLTNVGGTFVDLPTGTQHCVKVVNGDMSTTLALYQYKLEGTAPFLVAHPFDEAHGGFMGCNMFMLKVKGMWGAVQGRDRPE